jgi:predicted RNA-binding protein with TRAM domain
LSEGHAPEGDADSGGFKRFPRSYFSPKPVKIGDELDVDVSEMSRKGEGVARVEGYVVFVPAAKQGERKRIRIIEVRPNFAVSEVLGEARSPPKAQEPAPPP